MEVQSVIQGECIHKSSNALKITFSDGSGRHMATGVQNITATTGRRLATLFGFKNGGPGTHGLTYVEGRMLYVKSRDGAPSLVTTPNDDPVATITRAETSSATRPDGSEIVHFHPDPEEPRLPALFRLVVTDPAGTKLGDLHIIRKGPGWTLSEAYWKLYEYEIFWDKPQKELPLPFLGTRFYPTAPITDEQRDMILAACVDIAIGLRPYMTAMNERTSATG